MEGAHSSWRGAVQSMWEVPTGQKPAQVGAGLNTGAGGGHTAVWSGAVA